MAFPFTRSLVAAQRSRGSPRRGGVRILRFAPWAFLAFLAAWAVGADDDDPDANVIELGMRRVGSSIPVTLQADNVSCPGSHTFRFRVEGAPWFTVTGSATVTVAEGETGLSDATANLQGLAPGRHAGKVIVECTTCPPPPACEVDRTEFSVTVEVNVGTTFGEDPRDQGFATFGYGIADCCALLTQLSTTIGATGFGQGPRGSAILRRLDDAYLENGCSDITFIQTVDDPDVPACRGVPVTKTVEQYGVSPGPGEAVYFSNSLGGEEIAIGVDMSTRGIWQARRSPADYFVCLVDGRMAVVRRQDLVHNLVHEGLHAVREGTYNLNGRACLEEERDAFAAGNEACAAMNLPPSSDAPGTGYGATPNPSYQPVTGP